MKPAPTAARMATPPTAAPTITPTLEEPEDVSSEGAGEAASDWPGEDDVVEGEGLAESSGDAALLFGENDEILPQGPFSGTVFGKGEAGPGLPS